MVYALNAYTIFYIITQRKKNPKDRTTSEKNRHRHTYKYYRTKNTIIQNDRFNK